MNDIMPIEMPVRLLSRTDESDRELLLHMARKMADHKAV
jgi:hypothetical protein